MRTLHNVFFRQPTVFSLRNPVLSHLDRLFEQSLEDMSQLSVNQEELTTKPLVDVVENGHNFELHFDLPGVKPEKIELAIEGRDLRLTATREQSGKAGAENPGISTWKERHWTRFERVLTLPESAKLDSVDALYSNGVLSVTIPKVEEVKKRVVAIKNAPDTLGGASQGLVAPSHHKSTATEQESHKLKS